MAKSIETARRRLRRSRNVSSFFEESTENEAKTTMNVVVDVHNCRSERSSGRRRQPRDNENDLADNKRSSQSSKASSRSFVSETSRNADRSKRDDTADDSMPSMAAVESLEKPRRRKQWSTVASATNETEVDSRRPARKRWSKDAGVIRLPETTTSDDASPLIENSLRKTPVPAPRTSLLYDNPAFVSDNEDEVLRIETDHNRDRTKIEMRRMSDRSSNIVQEAALTGSSSRKAQRRDSDDCSSKARPLADPRRSRRNSSSSSSSHHRHRVVVGRQADSSAGAASLERIITDRARPSSPSSRASEERVSSSHRRSKPIGGERSPRRRDRSLFGKIDPSGDDPSLVSVDSSAARDAANSQNSAEADDARVRKKRKKKKRKQEKEARRQKEEEEEEEEEEKKEEEIKFISVTIHRADVLEVDYLNVRRPMVRVHIVEARTGSYLKKTITENGSVYLQPMITGKFDFKKNRSMIPVWEEELIFEHNFDAIMRYEEGEQVVILFEVIELLSFADASHNYDKIGSEGCWKKIAWAFLKPVGINNIFHTDKKVRLQLYKPRQSFRKYGKQKCEVYTWWQSNNRDRYPSSLLVTVTSVSSPKFEPVLHQKLPINDFFNDAQNSQGISKCTSESIGLPKWARLAAQSCKIPNEKMFETEVSEKGCFYVAFSNDGKYLACVHSEEYYYPIIVYEVEIGKTHVRFLGHKTFVYSLNWSSDDHYLLSTSADQTARVWDIHNQIVQHIEMLPHPSYVYCAKYGPNNATIVATGCYDRIVRIWAIDKRSGKRELSQELEGHEGFVNSMVFQKNGNLITADSMGLIILWTIRKDNKTPPKIIGSILKKIKVREIQGVIINTIVLHPLESRLLVHSRDNGLRMLDLATGVVLQKYKRLDNQRIQLKACISPCGGFVICGSEESVLNIWNLETGKQVAKYTIDEHSSVRMIITCVDYHPYDHVLVYSIFGSSTSVRVLRYNKNANGSDVGLHLMEDTSQIRGNEVILNPTSCPPSRQNKPSCTAEKKEVPLLSYHPTVNHTIIQIENNDYERPWTMPHHSREMERNWRKKSWDRLHCIIEKIDSILFGNSMFFDDVAETKQSSSANEYCASWTNASNNVALQRNDILLENRTANYKRSQGFLENAPLKKSNSRESSHVSSPDSAGTYIVETSNLSKNIKVAKEIDSVQVVESDSSRSNVTFLIENER
ncbi:jouberin isoform X2 [Monomorium pharaonis]|uniref:jouberin isoform X2 n=1 Tax=Monomorium pharaonis TaxID=307658 RepID=UPI00063EEF82|nr:jouberin isoform X2 [Monomorium pharaonis]